MNARTRTEHAEAIALMRIVALHEGSHPALRLLFAIPNGGDRHPVVAAKMKHEGVKSGVPDYFLPAPVDGCPGLFLELKSMSGYASKEQKKWIERLRDAGYRCEVARGAEAAWAVLCDYLSIPRRGA